MLYSKQYYGYNYQDIFKNKYDAIALQGTNGCNSEVGNGYIIEWLKKLELEQPFIITYIADDTLSARFLTPIKNPQKLAQEMYELCPDIID